VLNELPEAERRAVEQQLAADPAIRVEADEVQQVASLLSTGLRAEQAPPLDAGRREELDARLASTRKRSNPFVRVLLRSAAVLVLISGTILLLHSHTRFSQMDRQVQVTAATEQIQRLHAALLRYRADLNALPPDTGYGLPADDPNAGAGRTYDAGSLWRHLGQRIEKNGKSYGPYINFRDSELAAYEDPVHGKSYLVVDPRGTRIGYIGDERRVIHNRGAFDLFSAGPDGKTAADFSGNASNLAYDGVDNDGDGIVDNAQELGAAARNGCLTLVSADGDPREICDDLNNWDGK